MNTDAEAVGNKENERTRLEVQGRYKTTNNTKLTIAERSLYCVPTIVTEDRGGGRTEVTPVVVTVDDWGEIGYANHQKAINPQKPGISYQINGVGQIELYNNTPVAAEVGEIEKVKRDEWGDVESKGVTALQLNEGEEVMMKMGNSFVLVKLEDGEFTLVEQEGQQTPLPKEKGLYKKLKVGRQADTDIKLGDPHASRNHAELIPVSGINGKVLFIKDNSTNGIRFVIRSPQEIIERVPEPSSHTMDMFERREVDAERIKKYLDGALELVLQGKGGDVTGYLDRLNQSTGRGMGIRELKTMEDVDLYSTLAAMWSWYKGKGRIEIGDVWYVGDDGMIGSGKSEKFDPTLLAELNYRLGLLGVEEWIHWYQEVSGQPIAGAQDHEADVLAYFIQKGARIFPGFVERYHSRAQWYDEFLRNQAGAHS